MDLPIAVLTGDLIDSTALDPDDVESAFRTLNSAAFEIGFWQLAAHDRGARPSISLTRNRGDGWQFVVTEPSLSLRAALFIRAALRAEGAEFQTRVAIAKGRGKIPDPNDLNSAQGEVFVASGRALDALKLPKTMAYANDSTMSALVRLADHISLGWSTAQAKAVHQMLRPRDITHQAAAAALGVSRQSVEQSLSSAGFGALRDALTAIETNEEKSC